MLSVAKNLHPAYERFFAALSMKAKGVLLSLTIYQGFMHTPGH